MEKQISVVIIDDNKSLAYIIRDNIEKLENFSVVGIAHDGENGISLIKKTMPDVVILDIVMPKTDGLSVLEHFKIHSPVKKNIEFIILSALEHDLVTKHAVKLGALYYLIKPFEIKTLIFRLKQLFLGTNEALELSGDVNLQTKRLNALIVNELNMLGVPMHVKGYQYIKHAVKLFLEDTNGTIKITKEIYPRLAKEHNTSATSVERAIRNAVDITLSRGNIEYVNAYFNHEIFNNKITNKEFILVISNSINKNL